MKVASAFGFVAALASFATAQDASDADVGIIRQQLINVVAAVGALDQQVVGFTGPANAAALQSASSNVLTALAAGTSAVSPIQGSVTIGQAAQQLLDQVDALNNIVTQTVQDAKNQKAALVAACLGPTILDQLNQQLTAATTFRGTITSKFSADNQPLANSVSQPALDQLADAISAYSDQTSLPASCTTQSSAPAGSVSSSRPAGTSAPGSVTSRRPSSGSMITSVPASMSKGKTTTTTTVCPASTCKGEKPCPESDKPKPPVVTVSTCKGDKPCPTQCPGGCGPTASTTGPAKYTGAASHLKADALAALGVAMVMAL